MRFNSHSPAGDIKFLERVADLTFPLRNKTSSIDPAVADELSYGSPETLKMYCPQCGKQQLLEIARFCFNCGFSLSQVKQLVREESTTTATNLEHAAHQAQYADSITFPVPTPIEDIEKGMILATLKKTGDNKTRTAELLRISLKTLHNKLTLYRRQ
jgi:DNA-binding transcriptional MerR regulator